jgi:hypothetical protein
MKLLLTLVILFSGLISHSQQYGFRPGLIVTQSNDSIHCLVPVTTNFGDEVHIKKDEESDEETMSLSRIKYLITKTNFYENVVFQEKDKEINKLMWLKFSGKLTLYLEIVTRKGASWHQLGGTMTSFDEPAKIYVIKKDGSNHLIEEDKFIESISPLISDNTDILSKVATKFYQFKNIEVLVNDYNNAAKMQ